MAVTELSRRSLQSKQQEDGAQETIQLLQIWRELMTTRPAASEEGAVALYPQDAAFEFFRATESFAWLEHAKSLTVRLQRIGITVERRRVGPDIRRFYKVPREEFADLCERLIPP